MNDLGGVSQQSPKRFRPPTLSECYGVEGVKRLREMEMHRPGEELPHLENLNEELKYVNTNILVNSNVHVETNLQK